MLNVSDVMCNTKAHFGGTCKVMPYCSGGKNVQKSSALKNSHSQLSICFVLGGTPSHCLNATIQSPSICSVTLYICRSLLQQSVLSRVWLAVTGRGTLFGCIHVAPSALQGDCPPQKKQHQWFVHSLKPAYFYVFLTSDRQRMAVVY